MEITEALALKLISELKKPGRECLFDLSNKSYKNNHVKQRIWNSISNAIGINPNLCQAHWKTLRRRYRVALNKNAGRSGSERQEIKGLSKLLLTEMDYFQGFSIDKEPSTTNYEDGNTESIQSLFDEMARDPEVMDSLKESSNCATDDSSAIENSSTSSGFPTRKRRKGNNVEDAEAEYEASINRLNNLAAVAATLIDVPATKTDPFIVALGEEFGKVPESRKSALKVKLMSLVVEHLN